MQAVDWQRHMAKSRKTLCKGYCSSVSNSPLPTMHVQRQHCDWQVRWSIWCWQCFPVCALLTYCMVIFTLILSRESNCRPVINMFYFHSVGAQRTVPWLQENVLGRCCGCVWSRLSRKPKVAERTQSLLDPPPSATCQTQQLLPWLQLLHSSNGCYRSECIQVIASCC